MSTNLEKRRATQKKYDREYRDRNPEKFARLANDRAKKYRDQHPDRVVASRRRYRLGKSYSITPEQYDAMLAAQGGHCAICPTTEPGGPGNFHVDHDHRTGQVRGLLCHFCNTAIGLLKENVDTLKSAIAYLECASSGVVSRKWQVGTI